jgi:hypothetical protein
MPSKRTIRLVVSDRILTNGVIKRDKPFSGRAMAVAKNSGFWIAMRLGTSSPSTIDAKVMPATTIASAAGQAYGASSGTEAKYGCSLATSDASPKAPLKNPARADFSDNWCRYFKSSAASARIE